MSKPPSKKSAPAEEPVPGPAVVRGYMAEWSGPLPPPATLEAFDRLVENGAERIFAQFEGETAHRRSLETEAIKYEIRSGMISQGLAGAFAFAALGTSGYALYLGAYATAAVIGGGSIAMVVTAFLKRPSNDQS